MQNWPRNLISMAKLLKYEKIEHRSIVRWRSRFVTFCSLTRDRGIVDTAGTSNGANKCGRLLRGCGMVTYQLDFSQAANGLFRQRSGQTSVWVRLDPRRWSRLEVSDFSSRVYHSRRRPDGNSGLSGILYPRRKHRGYNRGPSATVVSLAYRYFASSTRSGWFITEKPREPKGLSEIILHSSEFNREYVITVRWHRSRNGASWRSLSLPISLLAYLAKWHVLSCHSFSLLRGTLAYWNRSRERQRFAESWFLNNFKSYLNVRRMISQQ